MFAPAVMLAGGELAFDVMKLPQLKEELASRDSSRSGLKAALQRRLHGLLVQAAIARHVEEEEEDVMPVEEEEAATMGRRVVRKID